MTSVFALYLFLQSATGLVVEIGSYPTLKDCQSAADASHVKSETPADGGQPAFYEWRTPLAAQWACIKRPSKR